MKRTPSFKRMLCSFVFGLALLGGLTFAASTPAHAQAARPTSPSVGCDSHQTFFGTNTDSTGVYLVSLAVHYTGGFLCTPDFYTDAQAFVAAGHSFNIRLCTGQAPESGHRNEQCYNYSGTAGLGGWYSPVIHSYHWTFYGCDGYADVQGHVGLASNIQNTRGCPGA
jgi:hypothetical protein